MLYQEKQPDVPSSSEIKQRLLDDTKELNSGQTLENAIVTNDAETKRIAATDHELGAIQHQDGDKQSIEATQEAIVSNRIRQE